MCRRPNIFFRLWLWLKRFRHRCGYGIHSPFAFNLTTQVIYQRGEFYAYAPLKAGRAGAHLAEKDDRLLLRLANDWQPKTCLLVGAQTDVSARYVRAGCLGCTVVRAASLEELPAEDDALPEMLVIDADDFGPAALARLCPALRRARRCLLVALRIGENTKMAAEWQNFSQENGDSAIIFDLYYLGLAYFGTGLAPQSYTINYV